MMQALPSLWWIWSTISSMGNGIKDFLGALAVVKTVYDKASFAPSTAQINLPPHKGGGFMIVDTSEFYYTRRLFKHSKAIFKWIGKLFLVLHFSMLLINVYSSVSDERKEFKAFSASQTDTDTACKKNPHLYTTYALKKTCNDAKAFVDNPFTPSFYWNIILRIWRDWRSCAVIGCLEIQETAKASTRYFTGWAVMGIVGFAFYGLLLVFTYDIVHYLFLSRPEPKPTLKSFERKEPERGLRRRKTDSIIAPEENEEDADQEGEVTSQGD